MATLSYILWIFLTWTTNMKKSLSNIIPTIELTPEELAKVYPVMSDRLTGKSGYIYYIRILHTPTNTIVYKIGYTTYTPEHRILGMVDGKKDIIVTIIDSMYFDEVILAYKYELKLHSIYRYHNISSADRITGLINNGMSELYHIDVLQLDTIQNTSTEVITATNKVVLTRLYCKCTRLQRAASPTAHVDSCPRYGMPLIL